VLLFVLLNSVFNFLNRHAARVAESDTLIIIAYSYPTSLHWLWLHYSLIDYDIVDYLNVPTAHFYLRQRRRYMFLPVFICLSAC